MIFHDERTTAAKSSIDAIERPRKQAEAAPDGRRTMLTEMVNLLLSSELETVSGAGYGEPSEERASSRSGYRAPPWQLLGVSKRTVDGSRSRAQGLGASAPGRLDASFPGRWYHRGAAGGGMAHVHRESCVRLRRAGRLVCMRRAAIAGRATSGFPRPRRFEPIFRRLDRNGHDRRQQRSHQHISCRSGDDDHIGDRQEPPVVPRLLR